MKVLTRILLPIAIVIMALACGGAMIAMKPKAARSEAPEVVVPVEVQALTEGVFPAIVVASGQVVAEQQIALAPEIPGRVVWVSEQLRPGGRLRKGEPIARLDERDYAIAVKQESTRVQQAELELRLEAGRAVVSEKEWELLGRAGADSDLAKRVPQLALAQQSVEAARSGLERAQLNLSRTTLRAPFDCVVVDESLDVGQYVGPGARAATLIGTEAFRVDAAVPVDRLSHLKIPGYGASEGSLVRVRATRDGLARMGVVQGLGGQLDPASRTALVLVQVPSPLDGPTGTLPLFAGSFVDVEIVGEELTGVIPVPRAAVKDGGTVWVASGDDHLRRRTVEPVWTDADVIYVREGFEPGDRAVVSPLSLPMDGVRVSIVTPDEVAK